MINCQDFVFQQLPLTLCWKDKQSVFLGCNERFLHITGLASMEDIVGRNDYDLPWAYTEANKYRRDDAEVIAKGESKLNYKEYQSEANGIYSCILVSKFPLLDGDKKIVGVIGVAQNIAKFEDVHMFENQTQLPLLPNFTDKSKIALFLHFKKISSFKLLNMSEVECLSLWIAKYSIEESVKILNVCRKTVEARRENIKQKTNIFFEKQIFDLIQEQKVFNIFLHFARITVYSSIKEPKLQNYILGKPGNNLPNLNINGVYLSKRETECVKFLIKGKTSKEIAKILNLSPRTIEQYLDYAKMKMKVPSRSELIEKIHNHLYGDNL